MGLPECWVDDWSHLVALTDGSVFARAYLRLVRHLALALAQVRTYVVD
jgi:hypothetical protein